MVTKVTSVKLLKEYFLKVIHRAKHGAPELKNIIYPLLGLILLHMDEDTDIEVRGSEETLGNILWIYIHFTRYAFRFEPLDATIEIREESFKGPLVQKIQSTATVEELEEIFKYL
jgi:hypothetical protein